MKKVIIDDDKIIEYIYDTLFASKINLIKLNDEKYHHNTSYLNAPLVCEYGLLTLLELNRLRIRNDSSDVLNKMNDVESHVNGNNGISLAVLGMDDLYANEEEYYPLNPNVVDFIISDRIKASRNTINYGNEYVYNGNISLNNILSLDFRLLEYINLNKDKYSINKLITMYNSILQSAINIKNRSSFILLREMSANGSFMLDIDKFSQSRGILLKRKSR